MKAILSLKVLVGKKFFSLSMSAAAAAAAAAGVHVNWQHMNE